MKFLYKELGDSCYEEVNRLLIELVQNTINASVTSPNQEMFVEYRQALNDKCINDIYRVISKYRRNKNNGTSSVK